jgi:hypothetical protein
VTSTAETAAAPLRLVGFTTPSAQIVAILANSEAVRCRLVLITGCSGEQYDRHRHLLAGELAALGQAFCDPALDGRLQRLGAALGLMAEAFRNPGPELVRWCNNVLDVPPRRLARHLDVLADALFVPDTIAPSGRDAACVPAALLARNLDPARIARLKAAPLPRRRW